MNGRDDGGIPLVGFAGQVGEDGGRARRMKWYKSPEEDDVSLFDFHPMARLIAVEINTQGISVGGYASL